jgi:uncharacterized protein (DUF362 family)
LSGSLFFIPPPLVEVMISVGAFGGETIMDGQEKVGLRFGEEMSGYLTQGEADYEQGEKTGKERNSPLSFEVTIHINDVEDFTRLSGRKAQLTGTVSYPALGENLPLRNGYFGLFLPDPATAKRHMTYSFGFTGNDGKDYFLYGYKEIYDDPKFDLVEDMTRLFTRIYRGNSAEGPLYGSGILRFRMWSLPSMLFSFEVTNTSSLRAKFKAVSQFFSFCYGELRDTYLKRVSPFYHSSYENLVLRGKLASTGAGEQEFFFFSGMHGKDFPWGDEEVFWDVGLIVQRKDGGWDRYAVTERGLEGLKLNVEEGSYRYEGPLYQIVEGYQLSRSELHKSSLPPGLRQVQARIEIRFDHEKYEPVNVPFALAPEYPKKISNEIMEKIREWHPHLENLGWHMTPHRAKVKEGKILLQGAASLGEYSFAGEKTMGEAEEALFSNLRWPKLYYNYFCSLSPETKTIYVKVRSDVLRGNRKDAVIDRIQQELGKVIGHVVTLDLQIDDRGKKIWKAAEGKSFEMVEENLLELNNDHFPTGVFQRRVVSLRDEEGTPYLALEEDMDTLNLGSIHSDRVVTAVAVRDPDKFKALDRVLEETAFFLKLDGARQESGKKKEDFFIVVKPNFMFMYNTQDRSTYTDPQLVEYLLDRIYERGYRNLAVAEARSTYGIFFTNREVKTVGRHIGLTEKNYRLIDLSEDLKDYQYSGKLGNHYVNREWKQADFRIAFAKNKTHSYARYTLCLKVIYGALPEENKFLEYHHKRDIYSTTIEFIRHFPIHFSLIDAHISADGPFGIFADKKPNVTETIIGSEDIVAADWIGAAKMGLDPMVSDYMKQAVEAFGKPQMKLAGDRSIYPGWVNVTDIIPEVAFGALDKNYYFGNLFYSVFAYMEPFFQYKDPGLGREFLRKLADPLKDFFFQTVRRGEISAELNEKLYRLFTGGTS